MGEGRWFIAPQQMRHNMDASRPHYESRAQFTNSRDVYVYKARKGIIFTSAAALRLLAHYASKYRAHTLCARSAAPLRTDRESK
jgi:hypothetical protein